MTESTESAVRSWDLVPVTWFAIVGLEVAMQAALFWDWPKAVLPLGLFVGAAVGRGVAGLLRPVVQAHQPSWTVICVAAFVGVPVILGISEVLRGDESGGIGTIVWGVPIALVAGVVAGYLARRFVASPDDLKNYQSASAHIQAVRSAPNRKELELDQAENFSRLIQNAELRQQIESEIRAAR